MEESSIIIQSFTVSAKVLAGPLGSINPNEKDSFLLSQDQNCKHLGNALPRSSILLAQK